MSNRLDAAAWEVAAEALRHIHPDAIDGLGLESIRRAAFPQTLDDIQLGAMDALRGPVRVARAVLAAARSIGPALVAARSPEEVEQLLIRATVDYLTSAAQSESAGIVSEAMARSFRTRPSLSDRLVSSALAYDWEERAESFLVRVVDAQALGGTAGTGMALCARGHVLTASHVVGDQEDLELAFRSWNATAGHGRELFGRARVIEVDPQQDIALLQCQESPWHLFREGGLSPARLSPQPAGSLRAHRVLCLGYKDPHVFRSPTWALGTVAPYFPVRTVTFRDGHEQPCLVVLIHGTGLGEPETRITEGMSGGAVLDLNEPSRPVVGMVTGATRRVFQEWHGVQEELDSAVYAFAVLLATVLDSFRRLMTSCCLT